MSILTGQAQVRLRRMAAWQDCDTKGCHDSYITVLAELEYRICFYR